MKPFVLLALASILVSARALAQAPPSDPIPTLEPIPDASASLAPKAPAPAPPPSSSPTPPPVPTDPKANTLVNCGKQKVAIFANTESKDGNYALGWTILPHRARGPVNWSAYDRLDPDTFLAAHPTRDDLSPGGYAWVNGVLDLRAKRFTPLPTAYPCYPHKPEVDLHVAWSDDQHGTRFALVGNDSTTRTFNLWLIDASPRKVSATDLAPAAGKAVDGFLRKQAPKQHADYQTSFAPADPPAGSKGSAGLFKGTTLEIPFRSASVKTDTAPRYAGTLTVTLSRGKVTGVQGKKLAP